jgi:hypothetical protein
MEMADWEDARAQRKRAVKTAWLLALVAALIFFAFILSGVLGS